VCEEKGREVQRDERRERGKQEIGSEGN